MKHLLIKTLAGFAIMLLPLTASAQYPAPPQGSDREQAQERSEARENDRIFDRIRNDLDHAHTGLMPGVFNPERSRVALARKKAEDCRRAIDDGQYDRRLFDEAVDAVQKVIDLNRLSDKTRNFLVDDVTQLRTLQVRLNG